MTDMIATWAITEPAVGGIAEKSTPYTKTATVIKSATKETTETALAIFFNEIMLSLSLGTSYADVPAKNMLTHSKVSRPTAELSRVRERETPPSARHDSA